MGSVAGCHAFMPEVSHARKACLHPDGSGGTTQANGLPCEVFDAEEDRPGRLRHQASTQQETTTEKADSALKIYCLLKAFFPFAPTCCLMYFCKTIAPKFNDGDW